MKLKAKNSENYRMKRTVTTVRLVITNIIMAFQINWEAYLNAKFSTNLQWNDTDLILIDSVEAFRLVNVIILLTIRQFK